MKRLLSAGYQVASSPRSLVSAVTGCFVALCIIILSIQHGQSMDDTAVRSSFYHLVLPASETSPNLCKTLFSAAVLDYPTPRLINWQMKFDNPSLIFGGSHIAKIKGVMEFLQQLGPQSDEELVSIVDGYDIWFQLRPETMVQRYHEVNDRANKRIKSQVGISAAYRRNIRQTVVFSAQKRCWPATADDPACFAVPESELQPNVYGSQTDRESDDPGNPFVRMRQRYLNSGTVIGPVRDVRAIYERAYEKLAVSSNIGSDQGIFAEIFGEQEYQRAVMSVSGTWFFWKIFSRMLGRESVEAKIVAHQPTHKRLKTAGSDTSFEFHIGLDYRGELSQPTVFSEDDLAWIKHTNGDLSEPILIDGEDRLFPPVILPSDIAASRPPSWVINEQAAQHLSYEQPWTNVSTYTNLWTGITPVAIHHNAHRDGLKSRIKSMWNETWYFRELRGLLFARAVAPRAPHAVVFNPVGKSHGTEEWWGETDERSGARIENGQFPGDWISWQDLCGSSDIASEVFRDGKGGWQDPLVSLPWDHGSAAEQVEQWKGDLSSSL